MTFKQTEVTEILKKLSESSDRYVFMNELVKEAYRLYKKVPIYPGIVGMCVDNVLKETQDIKKGDKIIVKCKGLFYEGKITSIKDGTVELTDVKVLQEKKVAKIKLGKNKVLKYNFSTLGQLWPSLNFEKK